MIRDCKRCGRVDDGTLVERVASCGCVNLYCERCRTAQAHGSYLSLDKWLESLARLHVQNGGAWGGQFPCPQRWDSNMVQMMRRSRRFLPRGTDGV